QRKIGVGELDPKARTAEQETQPEVCEQRGEPSGDRQPDGEDRDDEDSRADQQELIELVDAHSSSSTRRSPIVSVGGRQASLQAGRQTGAGEKRNTGMTRSARSAYLA